uniref:Schistosomula protein n=1 Tax=Schistosoma japonicum TaxID=6182 RepID=Q8MV16_SCHJA|nr:schistosomula protein [Schistosoma japonicum]
MEKKEQSLVKVCNIECRFERLNLPATAGTRVLFSSTSKQNVLQRIMRICVLIGQDQREPPCFTTFQNVSSLLNSPDYSGPQHPLSVSHSLTV